MGSKMAKKSNPISIKLGATVSVKLILQNTICADSIVKVVAEQPENEHTEV